MWWGGAMTSAIPGLHGYTDVTKIVNVAKSWRDFLSRSYMCLNVDAAQSWVHHSV